MAEQTSESAWLDLWKKQTAAPQEEKWKWSWKTWRPVVEKLMEGPIEDVTCPVCGQRALRYHFVIVHRLESEEGERYVADLWIGCEACAVQHHSRGLFPEWIEPESVEWAGPLRRRLAQSDAADEVPKELDS